MMKIENIDPAFKHIRTSVQHARLKGIKQESLNGALLHFGLAGTFDLDHQDALLLARAVFAYATSLIVERQRAAGGELTQLNLDEMNRELDRPAFLSRLLATTKETVG